MQANDFNGKLMHLIVLGIQSFSLGLMVFPQVNITCVITKDPDNDFIVAAPQKSLAEICSLNHIS